MNLRNYYDNLATRALAKAEAVREAHYNHKWGLSVDERLLLTSEKEAFESYLLVKGRQARIAKCEHVGYVEYIEDLARRRADEGVLTYEQYDLLADYYEKLSAVS